MGSIPTRDTIVIVQTTDFYMPVSDLVFGYLFIYCMDICLYIYKNNETQTHE